MRVREVRIGETYVVEVPHRLPVQRYPDLARPMPGSSEWVLWWLWGCRFRMTVTAVDCGAVPPMVEGLRLVPRSSVRVDLSVEQVTALGLPPGVYRVHGALTDDEDRPVHLPEVDTLRVPSRWLYPSDEDRPRYSHRDIDQQSW